MLGSKCSLNPYANSFIPSKKSDALREIAAKSVTELWEKKKASGEKTVTNQEIAKLVGHFISIGYKEMTNADKVKVQKYLNKKLLSSKVPAVRPVADLVKIRSKLTMPRTKQEIFDISKFQIPKISFLLVAFWGLYRHEQSQRPLLSLTSRPDIVKNQIWSIDVSDMKLWNQSSVSEACKCPPIFGYSVPSSFFGDLSHLHYTCPEKKIHLNHYSESKEGNEFILNNKWPHHLDEQPFQDIMEDRNSQVGVDNLKDQFETTILGICNLLAKFTEDPNGVEEDNLVEDETDYYKSLWDDSDSCVSHVPFSKQSRESLVDDNDHPLLEVSDICLEEEVSLEIKEMIRRSLSPKKDECKTPTDVDKGKSAVCDPPCSVWCNSLNGESATEETVNKSLELAHNVENFSEAPTIDLISLDQLSENKIEPTNITLNLTSFRDNEMKQNRSSSVADGYTSCQTRLSKLEFVEVTAHVSSLSTSRDAFAFPRVSENFKFFNQGDCEDTDSGFVSRSSSQDDIFGQCCDHEEKDSMWKLVSGEDSLWKPLPECIETNDTKMNFSHKRAHDWKRQRSVS